MKLLLNEIRDLLECAGYGAVEVYTIVYASERQSAVTIKWCDGNYMKDFSPNDELPIVRSRGRGPCRRLTSPASARGSEMSRELRRSPNENGFVRSDRARENKE